MGPTLTVGRRGEGVLQRISRPGSVVSEFLCVRSDLQHHYWYSLPFSHPSPHLLTVIDLWS